MATAPSRQLTADEFAAIPNHGFELVDGELVELPTSLSSSVTAGEIYAELRNYVKQNGLGKAFPPEAGIRCFPDDPDRVRKPDACFVCEEKIQRNPQALKRAFLPFAPDLVVEVVSPTDLMTDVFHKVTEYLSAGVRMVWVVDPEERIAYVYRLDARDVVTVVHEEDFLDGEGIVPGFKCRLRDVLPA